MEKISAWMEPDSANDLVLRQPTKGVGIQGESTGRESMDLQALESQNLKGLAKQVRDLAIFYLRRAKKMAQINIFTSQW